MKKTLKIIGGLLLFLPSTLTFAQDPAVGGMRHDKSPIAINESTVITADLLNASSTAFPTGTTVYWQIVFPPAIEYKGSFAFDDAAANTLLDVFFTPWSSTTSQVVTVTSKTGVPFPGNGAFAIELTVFGKVTAVDQTYTIQAFCTPPGLGLPGNDMMGAYPQISVSNVVLPLDLLSFTAKNNGCKALLEWTTVNEENTSHFSIEASNDGKNFKEVGTVKAAVNSKLKRTYNFAYDMDANTNYLFRLRMVDIDGKYTYSSIEKLTCTASKGTEIIASPNPATAQVKVSGLVNGKYSVMLMDLSGRQLETIEVEDNTSVVLDLSKYPAGIYNVSVHDQYGYIKNIKVAKQ